MLQRGVSMRILILGCGKMGSWFAKQLSSDNEVAVYDFYKRHGFRFVSMHPMFGPTFANMESLKEESVIIIKESDEQGKQFFKKFYSSLGLRVFEYSFKEYAIISSCSLNEYSNTRLKSMPSYHHAL